MRLSESRKVLPKGGATGVVEGASRQQVETWATESQTDKKEMSGILTMVILEEGGSERRRGEKRVVAWRTCVGLSPAVLLLGAPRDQVGSLRLGRACRPHGISTKIEQMKFQINYRARSSLIRAITNWELI